MSERWRRAFIFCSGYYAGVGLMLWDDNHRYAAVVFCGISVVLFAAERITRPRETVR